MIPRLLSGLVSMATFTFLAPWATQAVASTAENTPAPEEVAPKESFDTIFYPAPQANNLAYVSKISSDGKKHPAIIWLVGGFSNNVRPDELKKGAPENDQSASAFRELGVVTMYPTLRGGRPGQGAKEYFAGEVDDVIAAARYLRTLPGVDPDRVYVGGHSTGGTLALLAVESDASLRAAFAFGPASVVSAYGAKNLGFDTTNGRQVGIRSPGYWLKSIHAPTFVFEGTKGNVSSFNALAKANANPKVHLFPLEGADHFNALSVVLPVIAKHILADTTPECSITFSTAELKGPYPTR